MDVTWEAMQFYIVHTNWSQFEFQTKSNRLGAAEYDFHWIGPAAQRIKLTTILLQEDKTMKPFQFVVYLVGPRGR